MSETIHIFTYILYMQTWHHSPTHLYWLCSFHNLYLFKIQHLCHLMKWLSSLHHEKCIHTFGKACVSTQTYIYEPNEEKAHQKYQRKWTRHTHSWTEKEWLCVWNRESNEENRERKKKEERKKESNRGKKKNTHSQTHFFKRNVKKHAENYLQWHW